VLASVLLLAFIVTGLVGYKSLGGFKKLAMARSNPAAVTNVAGAESAGNALAATARYFGIVWPALAFGVLVGAAVQTLVTPETLIRRFGSGAVREQLAAAVGGAPLMLCSCCVAPVFAGVYQKTKRLGPALALAMAAPGLNPAAIAVAFLLLPAKVAGARVVMSLLAVLLASAAAARFAGEAPVPVELTATSEPESGFLRAYLRAVAQISWGTLPWIVGGVLLSALVARWLPLGHAAAAGNPVLVIALAALVALLLSLPTFFEIPLAYSLLALGAPAGAAAAVLFAGPIINLASLAVIGRSAGWKVAVALAALVWVIAVAGGMLIG
jgi:hypothetical protein